LNPAWCTICNGKDHREKQQKPYCISQREDEYGLKYWREWAIPTPAGRWIMIVETCEKTEDAPRSGPSYVYWVHAEWTAYGPSGQRPVLVGMPVTVCGRSEPEL
jgi:hypothetical protein